MKKSFEKPSMDLVKKYSYNTSYYSDFPVLGLWDKKFQDKEYRKGLEDLASQGYKDPSMLYIHFPYCPKICLYCLCFSVASKSSEKTKEFLNNNGKDMEMLRKFYDEISFNPKITRIHLGGGSPSVLNEREMKTLESHIKMFVDPKEVEEFAIEIDPRTVTPETMQFYHEMGINRISLGVQDFDLNVQKAVNRVQPIEMIESLITPEIRKNFKSLNFDMIYGLPRQTRESFNKTMDDVIRLSPDRLGVCILGWRPDIFPHQRAIKESELPSLEEGMIMNFDAIQKLLDAGYERIGIDFYAKPTDDLAIGLKDKTLRRSAMGYSRGKVIDCLGFGPSGMNRVGNYYFQREYDLKKYNSNIKSGIFPILRGWNLNKDEQIRRDIIEKIVCYNQVDFEEIGNRYNIDFKTYFKVDLNCLNPLIDDGIVELRDTSLNITEIGRFFHRHVCAAFDNIIRQGVKYKHARDKD